MAKRLCFSLSTYAVASSLVLNFFLRMGRLISVCAAIALKTASWALTLHVRHQGAQEHEPIF